MPPLIIPDRKNPHQLLCEANAGKILIRCLYPRNRQLPYAGDHGGGARELPALHHHDLHAVSQVHAYPLAAIHLQSHAPAW